MQFSAVSINQKKLETNKILHNSVVTLKPFTSNKNFMRQIVAIPSKLSDNVIPTLKHIFSLTLSVISYDFVEIRLY
jgi:hypothetical protein